MLKIERYLNAGTKSCCNNLFLIEKTEHEYNLVVLELIIKKYFHLDLKILFCRFQNLFKKHKIYVMINPLLYRCISLSLP